MNEKIETTVKPRLSTVRLRTWTLTLAIVITLGLFLLINVGFENRINFIDFAFIATIQIIVHCIYFPDGELYGMRDKAFVANRKAYNTKASKISQGGHFTALREYCKLEYEERQKQYIINECSAIGISQIEYAELKKRSPTEIDALAKEAFVYKIDDKEYILFLSKAKVKRLKKLLFSELPVERNAPETIMSAVENDSNKSIKDDSVRYKRKAYIHKLLMSTVVSLFIAFIAYKWKDGITPETFVQLAIYLTGVFATAVLSYSSGETCQRLHKNKFYIDLVNYIDGFNEWLTKNGIPIEPAESETAIEAENDSEELDGVE